MISRSLVSPIKSIQRGVSSVGTNTAIAISSVDTSKAVVNLLGEKGFLPDPSYLGYLTLESATVLRYQAQNGSGVVSWEVIEYA